MREAEDTRSGWRRLAVIGTGTMGGAILRRLLASGVPRNRLAGTVHRTERELDGLRLGLDNAEAARRADVVVIGVKPQMVDTVLGGLTAAGALAHAPLVISIAAGVPTRQLAASIPEGTPVVRAMPNTPVRIGAGLTVLSRGPATEARHVSTAASIFRPMGDVIELDEKHMNTATGLSASGPAFAYVIIESLAEGGVMDGLPRDAATLLAARALHGAAAMVLETGQHPAALKDEVTTPAGCTIGALLKLEDGKVRSVLARAVVEAARIAGGLGDDPNRKA